MDPVAVAKAKEQLREAIAELDRLAKEITKENRAIATLEAAGTTQASEYLREGRYLYLIHPQRNGHRRREYIGSDPAKIAQARGRVHRFKQAEAHRQELANLDRRLTELQRRAARFSDPVHAWAY